MINSSLGKKNDLKKKKITWTANCSPIRYAFLKLYGKGSAPGGGFIPSPSGCSGVISQTCPPG